MADRILLENVINHVLNGDTLKNALDFAAFLRANEFLLDYNPDESDKNNENNENKWTGAIGGVVGDSIGYLYVNSGADFPDPWNIWLNEYDFDDAGSTDDNELKEFVWGNVNHCAKCNPNWENCGGGERTVFGRKFERLCHSPMYIYMPDTRNLDMLKRLMLKIKEKRTPV